MGKESQGVSSDGGKKNFFRFIGTEGYYLIIIGTISHYQLNNQLVEISAMLDVEINSLVV